MSERNTSSDDFDRIEAPELVPTINGLFVVLEAAGKDRVTLVRGANSEQCLAFFVLLIGNKAIREVGAPILELLKSGYRNPVTTEKLEMTFDFQSPIPDVTEFMEKHSLNFTYSAIRDGMFIGLLGNKLCVEAQKILNAAGCTTNIV